MLQTNGYWLLSALCGQATLGDVFKVQRMQAFLFNTSLKMTVVYQAMFANEQACNLY